MAPTSFFAAATLPVNPEGEKTVLTMEQLWKGLELKVRKPQLFLPVMQDCKILEETDDYVLREVELKPGIPPPIGSTKEKITHVAPITPEANAGIEVFCGHPTGQKVQNIVSRGAKGTPEDLWLTFTFEIPLSGGSMGEKSGQEEDAVKKQAGMQEMAKKAVEGTVAVIRGMVEKGEL